MDAAKIRKQLNSNFSKLEYSRGGKNRTMDDTYRFETAIDEYDQIIIGILSGIDKTLSLRAQEARSLLDSSTEKQRFIRATDPLWLAQKV